MSFRKEEILTDYAALWAKEPFLTTCSGLIDAELRDLAGQVGPGRVVNAEWLLRALSDFNQSFLNTDERRLVGQLVARLERILDQVREMIEESRIKPSPAGEPGWRDLDPELHKQRMTRSAPASLKPDYFLLLLVACSNDRKVDLLDKPVQESDGSQRFFDFSPLHEFVKNFTNRLDEYRARRDNKPKL